MGEATQVTESQETYGTITLVAKPLAARIVVPNKMLQNALPTYEQQLRDDMTYQISRAIMNAALQGTGAVSGSGNTGAQPLGLLNITDVTQTALNGRPTIEDMTDAIGRIEDENIEMSDSWGWLFAPRTKRTFTSMTDQNGLPILRADWRSGEEQACLGWTTTPARSSRSMSPVARRAQPTTATSTSAGCWT
ncbi:MAG: phage major capsid protein [Candidatus Competibacteraceae bacterium]|nr:phage major capsid protein [Candidatus Competibacteraceae bacterium]